MWHPRWASVPLPSRPKLSEIAEMAAFVAYYIELNQVNLWTSTKGSRLSGSPRTTQNLPVLSEWSSAPPRGLGWNWGRRQQHDYRWACRSWAIGSQLLPLPIHSWNTGALLTWPPQASVFVTPEPEERASCIYQSAGMINLITSVYKTVYCEPKR